jgi:phage shock protein PspC (stress-responsive transcriptional regulator)
MGMKRLYRCRSYRWLGGVCEGLGEYFGVDPNLVRFAWALLTLASMGFGVLAYLAAWIILPQEPKAHS